MEDRLSYYLLGERKTGRLYLFFAVITMLAGIAVFQTLFAPFWRGLSIAILAIALIEYWVSWQFLQRYRRLKTTLPAMLKTNPTRYRSEEMERCEQLEQHYGRQRGIVILFIVLGMTLALLGGVVQARPLTMGMGFGLCLQGAILLVLDLAAQWRHGIYAQQVEHFKPAA